MRIKLLLLAAAVFAGPVMAQNALPTVPADSPSAPKVQRDIAVADSPRAAPAVTTPAAPITPGTSMPDYAVPREPTPQEVHSDIQTQQRQIEAAQTPAERPRARISAPPTILHIKPGINVVFGVAQDHLNRLITPFQNPVIETTSNATTSVKGNVIYVAPQSAEPIGFFIHENGDQTNAASVTMVPADIPPISVTLQLSNYVPVKADTEVIQKGNPSVAKGWETADPFTDTIKSLFRELAAGKVPDGYTYSKLQGNTPLMPRCNMGALRLEPKQLMSGYNMDAVIAIVTNLSPVTVDVNESSCQGKTVLAVAAWPRTRLAPGQSTELYLAVRAPTEATDTKRPSLLMGVK